MKMQRLRPLPPLSMQRIRPRSTQLPTPLLSMQLLIPLLPLAMLPPIPPPILPRLPLPLLLVASK